MALRGFFLCNASPFCQILSKDEFRMVLSGQPTPFFLPIAKGTVILQIFGV